MDYAGDIASLLNELTLYSGTTKRNENECKRSWTKIISLKEKPKILYVLKFKIKITISIYLFNLIDYFFIKIYFQPSGYFNI